MKTKFYPNPIGKGLAIPADIVDKTTLKGSETLSVHGTTSSLLLMNEGLTAWEIIETVDALNTIATGLLMRLESAAEKYADACHRIQLPEDVLKMAGIDKGRTLDIMLGEGEIYITETDTSADDATGLPDYLQTILEDCQIDSSALRHLLESEELLYE